MSEVDSAVGRSWSVRVVTSSRGSRGGVAQIPDGLAEPKFQQVLLGQNRPCNIRMNQRPKARLATPQICMRL